MASSPAPANHNEVRAPFPVRAKSFVREHGLLMVAAFIALLIVSAEARRPEATDLAQHRQEIEALSASQRQQLKTNVDWWRNISPQERESIREVHEAIATDSQLNATLRAYREWLDSIPGKEKSEILAIADPAERAKRVAAVYGEQEQRQKDREGPRPQSYRPEGNGPGASPSEAPHVEEPPYNRELHRPPLPPLPRLSQRDYHNIMSAIGRSRDIPPPPESASSERLLDFHLRVFEELGKGRRPGDDMRPPPLLEPGEVSEIAQLVPIPGVRERLKENGPGASNLMFRMLGAAMIEEVKEVVGTPSPADRQRLLKMLAPAARQTFEDDPPDVQERRLLALLLKDKSPTYGGRFMNFIEKSERMRRNMGRPEDGAPPPRGEFGPFPGGPNPRRRPDDGPPGDGPKPRQRED